MSAQPRFEEQELFQETVKLLKERPLRREWQAQVAIGTAFLAGAGVLLPLGSAQAFSGSAATVCIVVFIMAALIRLETPLGFTVVTQLAFVPMLFVLPVTLVPFAVTLGLLVARLIDVWLGRSNLRRLSAVISNSRFSLGPVLVFVLTGTKPDHASAAVLLLALFAQFAFDAFGASLEYRWARGIRFRAQPRDAWVYAVDAALSPVALILARGADHGIIELLALIPLLGLLAWLAQERYHRIRGVMELNEAYRGMAMVLGDVMANDDSYTSVHSREVVELAAQVGRELGLTPAELRHLDTAALLHDVGKIAIPKEIIHKPGWLDPEEFEIVKTHVVIGQEMLARVGGSMREVGLIVRSHHERWDGGGYPDGLRGERIPLASRIIACCDAWNAMRTDRVYRPALSVEQALQELRTNAGRQFDPQIAEIVLGIVTRAPSAAFERPERTGAQPAPPEALLTS